jgi:cytochrome c5
MCSGTKLVFATPGNAELAEAQKTWPTASLQSLEEGRIIYTTKCNTCHALENIPTRSEASWKHEIDDMAPKARLSAKEKELLTQYILSTRAVQASK